MKSHYLNLKPKPARYLTAEHKEEIKSTLEMSDEEYEHTVHQMFETALTTPLPLTADTETKSSCVSDTLCFLGKGLIIINSSACDTTPTALGIADQPDKIVGLIDPIATNIWIISSCDFITGAIVNGPEILEGIGRTLQILKERQMPAEWERLPLWKEIAAGGFTLLCSSYSVAAEGTATYWFWVALDAPKPLAAASAAGYAIFSSLLSEGRVSWEKARGLFLPKDSTPLHWFPKYTSYLFALFSGSTAIFVGYDGIQSTFDIEDPAKQTALLIWALGRFITDGPYIQKVGYRALISLAENPKLTIASVFYGAITAHALELVYGDTFATAILPFTMPSWLSSVLGIGAGVSYGVLATYGMSILLSTLTDWAIELAEPCRRQNASFDEERPPPRDQYHQLQRLGTFAQPSATETKALPPMEVETPNEPKPRVSLCSKISSACIVM